jgi:hypothetical protein
VRGEKFKAALGQIGEEFSKWMAEAAPAMRLEANFPTGLNQQPTQKDAEQTVIDNGNF